MSTTMYKVVPRSRKTPVALIPFTEPNCGYNAFTLFGYHSIINDRFLFLKNIKNHDTTAVYRLIVNTKKYDVMFHIIKAFLPRSVERHLRSRTSVRFVITVCLKI